MERKSLYACAASFLALTFAGQAAPARANGNELISREAITVTADVRLAGADGELSWIDGGFGKGRFDGSDDGGFRVRPALTELALAWQPRFTWSLSGTVVATAQHGQQHGVDLSESFLAYKPMADGPVRVSARGGLFWPPVSLEHSGPEWAVTETITPSAINSWIGEEVKVVGAEVTASRPVGDGRVSATVALFGFNDTAGTLIAFRGWALHDQKAVAFGKQPLPPLNAFFSRVQSHYTRPVIEIDKRVGYYAKIAWTPQAPVRIEALHYDNRGDPEAVNKSQEWGWRTRFISLGAVVGVSSRLELRAQGMEGRTEMGHSRSGTIWADTRFRSVYLLATRKLGDSALSGRIEAFGARNDGGKLTSEDDEDGWAAAIAARHPISPHATVLAEIGHVESRRGARARRGLDPRQQDISAQVALRLRL